MKKSEIIYLTALRGIASIWVGLHHAFTSLQLKSLHTLNVVSVIAYKGWLGVDLFFILSGFILAYSYQQRMKSFSCQTTYDFLMARVARVLPAHFFVMLILGVGVFMAIFSGLYHDRSGVYTFYHYVQQFFLIHGTGLVLPKGWNSPSWSIGAEMIAYFFFPVIILIFHRSWSLLKSIAILFFMIISLVIVSWLLYKGEKFMFDFELTPVRVISEFTVGILLFQIMSSVGSKKKGLFLPLILTGTGGVLLHPFILSHSFFDFVYLLYFILIILGCAFSARVIRLRFLSFLGDISYGFYLVHSLVIILLNQLIARFNFVSEYLVLILVLYFVVSLFCAWILYEGVEKPSHRLVLRWSVQMKEIATNKKRSNIDKNEQCEINPDRDTYSFSRNNVTRTIV